MRNTFIYRLIWYAFTINLFLGEVSFCLTRIAAFELKTCNDSCYKQFSQVATPFAWTAGAGSIPGLSCTPSTSASASVLSSLRLSLSLSSSNFYSNGFNPVLGLFVIWVLQQPEWAKLCYKSLFIKTTLQQYLVHCHTNLLQHFHFSIAHLMLIKYSNCVFILVLNSVKSTEIWWMWYH